jgi:hypothetical protein
MRRRLPGVPVALMQKTTIGGHCPGFSRMRQPIRNVGYRAKATGTPDAAPQPMRPGMYRTAELADMGRMRQKSSQTTARSGPAARSGWIHPVARLVAEVIVEIARSLGWLPRV